MIPYSTQSIDKKDISAVIKALKSERLTQGRLTWILKIKFQIHQI